MAGYWQSSEAISSDPIVAERMNNLPKIVFSRRLDRAQWQNTRLVKGDVENVVKRIKSQPGKDMAILGSGSIVSAFAAAGLIDEYSIMVNPVVLGAGRSIFQGIRDRLHLRLLRTRTFDSSGSVLLHYAFVK
ncbi:MAG TPA: dihydrofolate reductase family protein [Methanotrichaceae archaeon]|nr:dihydrofolate reductase family protein [Methanotrichaceae archaeon]HQF17688.1 dihydrofolate reductase family protein [Methanotrichaceae archaeon]HQI92276.1 dihydrofolate reductase family protein [Methanotrichaceae archaeon]HQJ29394.1 dihydrofolate reductase family protein [Methanotrichaceae archaeon]